jgi:hypothetical protein
MVLPFSAWLAREEFFPHAVAIPAEYGIQLHETVDYWSSWAAFLKENWCRDAALPSNTNESRVVPIINARQESAHESLAGSPRRFDLCAAFPCE